MLTQTAITLRMSLPQLETDIDSVCDTLELGEPQRDRLVRSVAGLGGGNPNIAVYRMVHALARSDIGNHRRAMAGKPVFVDDAAHIPLSDRALFHFFLGMEDFAHAFDVSHICEGLVSGCGEEEIRAATRGLVRILEDYRRRFLHAERHRRNFNAISRFLKSRAQAEPADGDAMQFWSEGSATGRWRYYSTTVGMFIDYHHDQQARNVVAGILHADSGIDAASDTAIGPADELPVTLQDALLRVQESPLKVFMDSEATRLHRLIRLGYPGASWPITGLTVTGYAPIQARVVQALRDKGELSAAEVEHHLSLVPESQATLEEIRKLSDLCQEAVHMTYKAGLGTGEIKAPPEAPEMARLRQLSRRASFRGRTEEELYPLLLEIIAPLLDIQAFLTRVIGQWQASVTRKTERLVAERALFCRGIRQTYLSGGPTDD